MPRRHAVLRGWLNLFRRGRLEREMDDELRFHLESRAEDLRRTGLSPADAHRQARLEFGGVELYKEHGRDASRIRIVEDVLRDVSYAWRSLRRTPGFTLTAASAIALGVAVNTALFSLIYAVVLRPLPVKDPGAIRNVFMEARGDGHRSSYGTPYFVSFTEFEHIRAHARTGDIAGVAEAGLSCKCSPDGRMHAQLVSDNLLPLIGATPAAGRFFTHDEAATPGSALVAVLSWSTWQQKFAAAPDIVGRTIVMNRTPFTIVGVADERTTGPLLLKPDVWIPFTMQALTRPGEEIIQSPIAGWIQMIARRRPGVSDAEMRTELALLGQQALMPHSPRRTAVVTVSPGAFLNYPMIVQDGAPVMAVLFVAVLLVLLIGCANVANMLLARGLGRQREIAVRLSIGAGRWRLFQQFLTESVVLGLIGGALGLALSQLATRLVLAGLPGDLMRPVQLDLSPDWRIVIYTLALSLFASLVFGMGPAIRLLRADLTPTLKADTLTPASTRRRVPVQALLIAAQAMVSVVLLVNAALLLRGFDRALHMDRGHAKDNVLIASFDLRQQQYTADRAAQLLDDLRDRVGQTAGVRATAVTSLDPLVSFGQDVASPLDTSSIDTGGSVGSQFSIAIEDIGPDYFQTMRIPLLQGRGFEPADVRFGSRVAVVDEALARRIAGDGGANVLGRRLRLSAHDVEIVGVVASTKTLQIGQGNLPKVYVPMREQRYLEAKLLVSHDDPQDSMVQTLRRALADIDPNVNIAIKPIEQNVLSALAPVRIAAAAASALGALGLLLGCTGLYGVVAFSVGRRRREIGIRMALGARRAHVLRTVVGQGLIPVLVGAIAGLALAAASGRLLRALLFGVSPLDPVAFGVTVLGLTAAAALATLLPARAALRVDPAVTLRHE